MLKAMSVIHAITVCGLNLLIIVTSNTRATRFPGFVHQIETQIHLVRPVLLRDILERAESPIRVVSNAMKMPIKQLSGDYLVRGSICSLNHCAGSASGAILCGSPRATRIIEMIRNTKDANPQRTR